MICRKATVALPDAIIRTPPRDDPLPEHKNPDFVLEKTGIGIEKSNRGLPANHRARFQNANTS